MQTDEIYIPTGKERRNQILVLVLGAIAVLLTYALFAFFRNLFSLPKVIEANLAVLFSVAVLFAICAIFLGSPIKVMLSRWGVFKFLPLKLTLIAVMLLVVRLISILVDLSYMESQFPESCACMRKSFIDVFSIKSILEPFMMCFLWFGLFQNLFLKKSLLFNILIICIPSLVISIMNHASLIASAHMKPDITSEYLLSQEYLIFAVVSTTIMIAGEAWQAYVYRKHYTLWPVLIFIILYGFVADLPLIFHGL